MPFDGRVLEGHKRSEIASQPKLAEYVNYLKLPYRACVRRRNIMKVQKLGLTIIIYAALLSGYAAADEAAPQDIEALIRDGIALHDQQRYADAIALYERALKLDPDNAFAGYEMAFAYQVSGDLPACIESASGALERGDASGARDYYLSGLYKLLASCQSASGDSEQALQVFRDGLQRFPNNYGLHFNIAITLAKSGDLESARQHFVTAMTIDSAQPSPYYMLGEILSRQGFRPAALLAYIAFLQHEFNTERSYRAAAALINTMYAPKANDDAPIVTVNVEDDVMRGFTGLQMSYYSAKIERTDDDKIAEPLGENLANALHAYLRMASVVEFDDGDGSFVAEQLLPKTVRIAEAGVAEPFAWFVLATARVSGAKEWMEGHSAEVDQLVDLLNLGDNAAR